MAEVGRCAEARRGCCWRALVMRKIGRLLSAAIFPNMQERLGGFGDPSFGALLFFVCFRYPPAFGGRRVFLCRGALQKSENMIYLLHSRTSCGGDMTDFGDLPRDAVDGARYAASSPRGNARSRRSAFCGRVIFGGKI